MATVYDYANDFIQKAKNGENPTARLDKDYAGSFLGVLAREGFTVAKKALDEIKDPELRRIVETIFFSTAAGTALGAAVGGTIGGRAGAAVGAVTGAAIGFAAGCIAVTLTVRQEGDALVVAAA